MSIGIGLGVSPIFGGSLKAFSPLDISGLVAWYEASRGVTLNGSDVSQWSDLSGNLNHLIQATPGDQPLWVDSTYDYIDFDGAGEHLKTALFTGGAISQPNTIMIIAQYASLSGTPILTDGLDTSNRHNFYVTSGSPNKYTMWADSSPIQFSTSADTNKHIWTTVWNGSSSEGYIDGGGNQISGSPGSDNLTGFLLGERFSGSNSFTGKVYGALIYSKALSNEEKNLLGNHYADQQGLTWTDIS